MEHDIYVVRAALVESATVYPKVDYVTAFAALSRIEKEMERLKSRLSVKEGLRDA